MLWKPGDRYNFNGVDLLGVQGDKGPRDTPLRIIEAELDLTRLQLGIADPDGRILDTACMAAALGHMAANEELIHKHLHGKGFTGRLKLWELMAGVIWGYIGWWEVAEITRTELENRLRVRGRLVT